MAGSREEGGIFSSVIKILGRGGGDSRSGKIKLAPL